MALKRNGLLILIAFIVFAGSLLNYLDRVPQRHYCDFRVYYKAGQDFIRAKDIYFRETEEITPFKYSPFFAFVFAPLSLLPIKAAAAVFFTINFLSTILFYYLSFHLVRHFLKTASFSDRDCFLIYALVALCSLRYVLLVWDSGQVTIIMSVLVVMALSLLSKDKGVWTGAFFAAAILIKYTPAIFLPYLLIQRKFKAVLWSVFFVVLFLMLPALVVGVQKESFYLSSWIPSVITTSLDKLSYIDLKNQSIFSMFLRFFSPTEYNVQIFSLSFDQALYCGRLAALVLYLMVLIPGKLKQESRLIDFAMLMICVSLFNPNAWFLNFVSLILPFMLLIQYLFAAKERDWFILFSLVVAFIMANVMSKDILGKTSEYLGEIYSFTAFGSLIIYAALLKLKFAPKQLTLANERV